ncbi:MULTISPECIES: dGTP triphosphohydrolase [unclassified Oceanispirochaeta]|uniref:dGTP triphosphohydrolase n=1 Tax=unclassified Oceanispirochaeta TaxID=2635722 RepID=UPI000E094D04|nr:MULTISPECIES: dNTP triphosphohydrolase [unclassified Oceanispirochaeta]MBF9018632.1 dNTP triphosphohydrolase [Oceanispirochaeta sp. M2]NPD75069.1 dNTP triphosphohydrolase [Oceanispirochaeta sp. M1]RDG29095.1 dNTP triphosphohydrolase [Oceanispirochaeta sp. M1]
MKDLEGQTAGKTGFYKEEHKNRIIFVEEGYRCPYRRDYARLIHSPSFRRLQGKTQLFPGIESDFFRNRLTHSLEVAQVAKSIAQYLNHKNSINLNEDIVEFAGLAHDLGHPPFGHNGEKALDYCMKEHGGFEGNAQTIRILTRIEKKEKESESIHGIDDDGSDNRRGLNLTYRSIASTLKYDNEISVDSRSVKLISGVTKRLNDLLVKNSNKLLKNRTIVDVDGSILGSLKLEKGYYAEDRDVIHTIKEAIAGDKAFRDFRTIECDIMDIADDIAYSTYDLEDALKARFISPLDMVFVDNEIAEIISKKINSADIDVNEVRKILLFTFIDLFELDKDEILQNKEFTLTPQLYIDKIREVYKKAHYTGDDGYTRVVVSSKLVDSFINAIDIEINEENIALSKIRIDSYTKNQIEVLKHFTYETIINSSMLKVSENRGYDIVRQLFERISNNIELLPEDFQSVYKSVNHDQKKRVICDFIAGMTDRYAMEFHARLFSYNPESIFKPL